MFYNDLWRYWGFGGTQETEVWIRDSEETHMEGVLKISYIQSALHDITPRPLLYFIRVLR
jgi:hypothetical protein